MIENLKKEWINDLEEKIQFIKNNPAKPEYYLLSEYKDNPDRIRCAKMVAEQHNQTDAKRIEYLVGMIAKVKSLRQNPVTDKEKLLWLELMKELNSDFRFNHDSRNQDMGWAGRMLLSYLFGIDMEEQNGKQCTN